MTQIRSMLTRANAVAAAGVLVFAAVLTAVPASRADALSLLNRSLNVTSTVASDDTTAPDGSTYTFGSGNIEAGDARNGQKVGHLYTFNVQTSGNLEGFVIEYCDSAFGYLNAGGGACAGAPTGFSALAIDDDTGTVDVEVNGAGTTSFDVTANAANFITIADTVGTGVAVTAGDTVTVDFTGSTLSETAYFVNPNTAYKNGTTNGTYFAHIYTFDDDANATGAFAEVSLEPTGFVDDGSVTNSVTTAISIYTRVQETLNFSVEGDGGPGDSDPGAPTDPDPGSIGACEPLTEPGFLYMGDTNNALDVSNAHTAKSYFRLATNATNGTNVYYAGDTLRSGANTITAIGPSQTASTTGTEQFGLAFDSVDADGNIWDDGSTTGGSDLVPVADYEDNTTGYAFEVSTSSPKLLAQSVDIDSGTAGNQSTVVSCDTGAVEYVANISVNTEAGIYTTKINYIAAPSY